MRANDAVNLRIYALILESYNESADLYGNIGNLIGLLFHDLMIHFTSIVELKALTDIRECGKANFPFVTNTVDTGPLPLSILDSKITPLAAPSKLAFRSKSSDCNEIFSFNLSMYLSLILLSSIQ